MVFGVKTPFAILLSFCFHRGDQFFHLRVVECGERTVPYFSLNRQRSRVTRPE